MRIYPYIYEHLVYPVYHGLKGDERWSALREIRDLQWQSPENMADLQRKKLSRLLQHAYDNVPYYKKLWRRLGVPGSAIITERFEGLPVLEKNTIRKNFCALLADSASAKHGLIPNSTGGSTGEKLHFYMDKSSEARRMATTVCEHEALGIRMGEREVRLWGAPLDVKRGQSWRGKLHEWITNHKLLSTYELSDKVLHRYYEILKRFKPKVITSYPSPLAYLCEYMQARGLRICGVQAVICSAETLYRETRELIETTFSCQVYNRYGSREFGSVAHEYPCTTGLHVHSDRVLVEILDEKLTPVPLGDPGEMYITDLDNYGMPFIRYRTGDIGRWRKERYCPCGRGWPLLDAIEGRSFDIVKAPNGNALGGTFWTILFRERPGIKQFQVYQPDVGHIIIRYLPEDHKIGIPLDSRAYWSKKIMEACGSAISIEYHCVDRIAQTSSGKKRIVISDAACSK
jgi:phenylacetate-CoA ligase